MCKIVCVAVIFSICTVTVVFGQVDTFGWSREISETKEMLLYKYAIDTNKIAVIPVVNTSSKDSVLQELLLYDVCKKRVLGSTSICLNGQRFTQFLVKGFLSEMPCRLENRLASLTDSDIKKAVKKIRNEEGTAIIFADSISINVFGVGTQSSLIFK